jgi:hypothetical protein
MSQPHAFELVRSLLVYLHLMAMIAAGIAIAFGDYAILRHRPINRDLMLKSARAVTWSLCALWITGLTIISVDMSTTALVLSKAPKLQAKLTVVLILTANGFLLHRYTLSRLGGRRSPSEQAIRLAAILGAVSAASWGYAVFLGVARAWAPILGYSGFIALYAAGLAAAIAVSLRWVRPMLLSASRNGGAQGGNTSLRGARSQRSPVVDDDLNAVAS